MLKRFKKIMYLFPFFALLSCGKGTEVFYDGESYAAYAKDTSNAIRQSITVGENQYSVQYKTPEYILLEEQHISQDDTLFNTYKKELEENFFFTFRIENLAGIDPLKYMMNDASDYDARLRYFSFQAQHDFFLLAGNDTLKCVNMIFEGSYGISPTNTFLLAFEKVDFAKHKAFRFVFFDRVFGNGAMQFNYTKETIQNIPQLIL